MANRVEKEYAVALFELDQNAEDVSRNLEQLINVNSIISENEDLKKFFNHPLISKDEKKDIIKKSFGEYNIIDFLYVLVDNNRILDLKGIIDEYEVLYYKSQNIIPLEVITAAELSSKYQKEIVSILEKKFMQKINVRFSLNSEIIGGIVLKYNGQVLDNSCLAQLSYLKDFLKN